MHPVEALISTAVQGLRLAVETIGAAVVGLGVLVVLWTFARAVAAGQPAGFNQIRLAFARYLALALEFQLGADIHSTSMSPRGREQLPRDDRT